MNSKIEFAGEDSRIVYVRPVKSDEVPSEVDAAGPLYSVHTADGEQLAIVEGRKTAFDLARENDLAPVAVH